MDFLAKKLLSIHKLQFSIPTFIVRNEDKNVKKKETCEKREGEYPPCGN